MTRLIQPLAALDGRLGLPGLAAGVVTAVTSPTGRSLTEAGHRCRREDGRVGGPVHPQLGRPGVRLFGSAGNRAAEALSDALVSFGGRIAVIAASVAHRIARMSDPETTHIRLLAGLARSFLVHRVLRLLVRNPIARFVVELVASAAALDIRPVRWLRDAIEWLRARARTAPPRPSTMLTQQVGSNAGTTTSAPNQPKVPRPSTPTDAEPLVMPAWNIDGDLEADDRPEPSNRAERAVAYRTRQTGAVYSIC